MTSRAMAIRYARALFDVVMVEGADPQQTARELAGVVGLLADHEGLARALTHPAIPAAKKRAVIEHLLARSGPLQVPLSKLLLLLADRDRVRLLAEVSEAFERRLMDHLNVVAAEVVTAIPLPPDRVIALRDGLVRTTGRQVQLETRVDPGILGGAIARIGSTVYDGSVTRQLDRLKETLASAAE